MASQTLVNDTGVIVSDIASLKSDVQAEYKQALGSAMSTADATPQGRLIDGEVAARAAVMKSVAAVANQINPNISTGIFLESLAALHGIDVLPSTRTVAPVIFRGTLGRQIPSGTRLKNGAGELFSVVTATTISSAGTATTTVQAVDVGAIDPTGIAFVDGILGVTGVEIDTTKTTTLGRTKYTDPQIRQKRDQMLFKLARGQEEALFADVLAIDGVRAVTTRTNPTAAATTVDGVELQAHGTWVCVEGGIDADVALAILGAVQKGSPLSTFHPAGTSFITVRIEEPYSKQSYDVPLVRPAKIPCGVRVTISRGSSTVDLPTTVADAILEYQDGELSGLAGIVQGADLSPFEIAAAVAARIPGSFVSKVEVTKLDNEQWSPNTISFNLWERAELSSGHIQTIVV